MEPSSNAVIQRSAITLGGITAPGSVEEDWATFWDDVVEKNGDDDYIYGVTLAQISEQVRAKGMAATPWDTRVGQKALTELADEAHYRQLDDISKEQGLKIKSIFGKKDEMDMVDQPITEKDIIKEGLTELLDAFVHYAGTNIKGVDNYDDESIDIQSDESPHDTILQRAIFEITKEYGLKMAHAVALSGDQTAMSNLNNAKLQHSTSRFKNAQAPDIAQASEAAVYWVLSSEKPFDSIVQKLHHAHGGKSSTGTIINAYAQEVLKVGKSNKKIELMLQQLAEIRLKWGPITYGKNIYVQVKKDKINMGEQWTLYQTLVHESLHSAEHPGFHQFLENHVPSGYQSNIREGVVEYLTMKIWDKIIKRVEEGASKPPAELGGQLKASKSQLSKMQSAFSGGKSDYPYQMGLIDNIVQALEHGDQRLEAAYFYGNVAAFLPKDL